jgi:predicted Zn-dependent peptidase
MATPKSPHTIEEVEQAVYEEIERLKEEGPTEWELWRVRNQLDADYVRALQSNVGLAYRLADMQAKVGDWSYLLEFKEKRQAVTADDIKRVVSEYLDPANRTVAYMVKPESDEPAGRTMRKGPAMNEYGRKK